MKYVIWSIKDVVELIKKMRENKFDCIIMIDGKRGIGKSTLGSKIMYRLGFHPKRDIVYSREDVVNAYAKKRYGNILADEMINVSYGRDFWDADQKTLIKLMNMYRDSCNVFIGCVPIFSQLDKHIQGLVKIRFTVIRRGLAIINKQISSVYTNDPWDIKNNQKLESRWTGQDRRPQYTKLSTFVGILRFGDLTPEQREEIEKVKQEKRNKLIRINDNDIEELDYLDRLLERVYGGTLTTKLLMEYCNLTGKDYNNVRAELNKRIREDPKSLGKTLREYQKEADSKDVVKIIKKFRI